MSKLIVEIEFDESWDAYIPDNQERINNILMPMLDGVTVKILEELK